MKNVHRLKFLFFIIAFLLGCILAIEFLDKQEFQSEPEPFYCGTTDYSNAEEIDSEPRHDAGEQLFKENCKSCHRIHEESVGPALFGVSERRPRKWIYAFIQNSGKLIKKKDTMAVNIYNKYGQAEMTAFTTFTHAEIDSILIYIESSPIPGPVYSPEVIAMP
ncbi:MAG TPA: cytochrome c [Cytophaga sp.]|nr:cytochrome c [Cytophaga sp.]